MSFFKKASRMQGFLNRNHRDIVVKAQRGDVEQHCAFVIKAPDVNTIVQRLFPCERRSPKEGHFNLSLLFKRALHSSQTFCPSTMYFSFPHPSHSVRTLMPASSTNALARRTFRWGELRHSAHTSIIPAPTCVRSCFSYPSRMVLRLFGFVESVGADVDCFLHHLLRLAPQILRLVPNLI
jgi:hypothetical protein